MKSNILNSNVLLILQSFLIKLMLTNQAQLIIFSCLIKKNKILSVQDRKPLQGMESHEKEEHKDKKHIEKII